jgi:tetratricopeptide (TPR) repeat protein
VLAWADRYDQSLASWDSLVVAAPQDVETRLGRAAARTFAGDIPGAEVDYLRVLEIDPASVEALQGLARARSWDGRLVEGEATYRRAVAADGANVEALVGLGQNLRWQGRDAAALEVLQRAEALAPGNADVREQLQWVRVNTAPRARLSYATEEDSDGNDLRTTTLIAEFNPIPRLGLRTDLYRRDVDAPGLDREAVGARVRATWQLEPGWALSLGGGISENDGDRDERIPSWEAAISTPGRHAFTAGLSAAGSAIDATAALADLGVEVRQLDLNATWSTSSGLRVSAAGGVAEFEGTESNRRGSGSLSLRQRLSRSWTVGAMARAFSFEKDLADGYFDPDFFGLVEASVRWSIDSDTWSLALESAPGVQQVGGDGEPTGAVRASGRVAWRAAPGREVWLSGGWSSTGLQRLSATGGSDYRYEVLSAGVSWVF